MALLSINDADVIQAEIRLPLFGRGSAKIVLDDSNPVPERFALRFEGGTEFSMSVAAQHQTDMTSIRAVLGARGLEKTIDQRFYEGIPIETVIRDILRDSGEAISSVKTTGFFNQYQRVKSTAAQALKNVLNEAKLEYGYGFDGRVWVGLHQWQTHPETLEATSNAGASRMWCVDLNASLQPGFEYTIFDSNQEIQVRVEMVEHLIYAEVQETRLWGAYD